MDTDSLPPDGAVVDHAAEKSENGDGRREWRTPAAVAVGWSTVVVIAVLRLSQSVEVANKYVAIVQALTPWLMLAALAMALAVGVMLRVRRHPILVVALTVSVLAMAPLFLGYGRPGVASSRAIGGSEFTMLTANMYYRNQTLDAAFDDIEQADADMVLMWEMQRPLREALASHPLGSKYAYTLDDTYGIGLVVLSRFPITNDGADDWMTRRSAAMTLSSPGGEVRVIGTHPATPLSNPSLWSTELQYVGDRARALDVPAVIAGDLNAGWFHPEFRKLVRQSGVTDALPAAGHKWTMTWPTDMTLVRPFVQLDHVLVNNRLVVIDARAVDVAGSDHRAVIATLALADRDSP